MSSAGINPQLPIGGFSFENYQRNEFLVKKGYSMPEVTKTGTTIAGIVFKDGVILGADTRVTSGPVIADKNCEKIHYLQPNMYCCGAGTAADNQMVTRMMSSQLELYRLNTGKLVPVCAATRFIRQYLYRYRGHIGAAFVLGGVDANGAHIYSIYPHGSINKVPFATLGSGSMVAMAVFESRWKENMTLEKGKQLVRDAIIAGIFNDLGSGSNVDLCVITLGGADYLRTYEEVNIKGEYHDNYHYKRGTADVLTTKLIPLEVEEMTVRPIEEVSEENE